MSCVSRQRSIYHLYNMGMTPDVDYRDIDEAYYILRIVNACCNTVPTLLQVEPDTNVVLCTGYSCPTAYPASVAAMASAGAELLPPTDENAISCSFICGEPARWSLASFTPPPSAFGAPKVATGARGAGWSGANDGFLRRKGLAPIFDKQCRQQHHDCVGFGVEASLVMPFARAIPPVAHQPNANRPDEFKSGAPTEQPQRWATQPKRFQSRRISVSKVHRFDPRRAPRTHRHGDRPLDAKFPEPTLIRIVAYIHHGWGSFDFGRDRNVHLQGNARKVRGESGLPCLRTGRDAFALHQ